MTVGTRKALRIIGGREIEKPEMPRGEQAQ